MEMSNPTVAVCVFPAVLSNPDVVDDGSGVPYRLDLVDAGGYRRAGSWMFPFPGKGEKYVRKAEVTALAAAIDPETSWLVTETNRRKDIDVFGLIPDDFGPLPGTVQRVRDLVDSIETRPLREFLSDAFSLIEMFHSYWTCPASQNHHHDYRGGHALHSIEMAEWVAETPRLGIVDRDIGIAYALLHDVGKLWCYTEYGREHLLASDHELVGVAKLNDALEDLQEKWPGGAVSLRSLLSGAWKSKGALPLLSVGKLVQACDQRSCEADLRPRTGHRYQPWVAKPCLDNVRNFPSRQ